MTTKEKYENKLQKLNERFEKNHAEMVKAYEQGDKEKGHRLNDKLENMLDVILLTETVLDTLK